MLGGKTYSKTSSLEIDCECWMIMKNEQLAISKKDVEGNKEPKKESDYDSSDFKRLEKNAKAMYIV